MVTPRYVCRSAVHQELPGLLNEGYVGWIRMPKFLKLVCRGSCWENDYQKTAMLVSTMPGQ